MENIFKQEAGDKGLVITLKIEANNRLSYLKKKKVSDEQYTIEYNLLKDSIDVAKSIELTEPNNFQDVNYILKAISGCWNNQLLSPLTLQDDEFSSVIADGKYYNKRYKDIYLAEDGYIYNSHVYNMRIWKYYNHNENKELNLKKNTLYVSNKLYISKGGVITGEYIKDLCIRKEYVDRHSFEPQVLIANVSAIFDNDNIIYVIDHRAPELKTFKIYYHVPIYKDDYVAKQKYNLRKYVKLNKQ